MQYLGDNFIPASVHIAVFCMKYFVGTSGWLYSWNKEGTLDWYLANSGLNAIELNASFYRFPFPNQVKGWARKGGRLSWSVKMNRQVTHVHMLNDKAEGTCEKFMEIFKPLDKSISFYLFQMPPNFSTNLKNRLQDFMASFGSQKTALEFRHKSWYDFDFSKLDFDGVIVSPDSPEFNGHVVSDNRLVYLRFHGRRSWYSYEYSEKELQDMARKAKLANPKKMFAFFNNDHDMLGNARLFLDILNISDERS